MQVFLGKNVAYIAWHLADVIINTIYILHVTLTQIAVFF